MSTTYAINGRADVANLPKAIDAEKSVLCTIFMREESLSEVSPLIGPLDFADKQYGVIFRELSAMRMEGVPISAVILGDRLQGKPCFEGTPISDLLKEIGRAESTSAHAAYYAKIVRETSHKRRLYLFGQDIQEDALNGRAAAEIVANSASTLADFAKDSAQSNNEIESHPLSQFVKLDHRQDFLIDGIIGEAQPGVISAKSKSQKTTIALDAALSIGTGVPFLDSFRVSKPLPCGIISGESGGATLVESFNRIALTKGIDPGDVGNVHVSTQVPNLTDQAGRDLIERFIDDNELRCLFVDPTYAALPGAEDSQLSKMGEILFPISDVISRTGCSIVMVHHNRKTPARQGDHYAEPTLDDIGGTGIAQWARFWILLNKRREWEPNEGRHWLWLCTGSSAGYGTRKFLDVHEGCRNDPGGRVWDIELCEPSEGAQLEREAANAQKDAQQMEADRKAVCNVLASHTEGLTKTKMFTLAKISRRRHESLLDTLIDEGDIEETQVKVGSHKTTTKGFKLSEQEAI